MRPIRQGDVILLPVKQVTGQKLSHFTLALGEVTGHSHRIGDGQAELYEQDGTLYLRVLSKTATLNHEEHHALKIPQGNWMVRIQREYAPLKRKSILPKNLANSELADNLVQVPSPPGSEPAKPDNLNTEQRSWRDLISQLRNLSIAELKKLPILPGENIPTPKLRKSSVRNLSEQVPLAPASKPPKQRNFIPELNPINPKDWEDVISKIDQANQLSPQNLPKPNSQVRPATVRNWRSVVD